MIEYIDVEVTLPPPVKKQIWNGEKFVPMTLYRTSKKLTHDQIDWLRATYGVPGVYMSGRYWHYASGNGLMDEQVYMFYKLKWAGK